jgi:hypothetical protein
MEEKKESLASRHRHESFAFCVRTCSNVAFYADQKYNANMNLNSGFSG